MTVNKTIKNARRVFGSSSVLSRTVCKNLKFNAWRVAPRSVFHCTVVKNVNGQSPQGDRYLKKVNLLRIVFMLGLCFAKDRKQKQQQRTTDIRLEPCFAKDHAQKLKN
jgi:hypothetical protein